MYLSYGKHYIAHSSYDTYDEMSFVLSKCEAGSLILGESAEQPTVFYSVISHLGWNGRERFGLGICSQEFGLKPHLLLKPKCSQLLLGFNNEVVAVSITDRQIHFQVQLDALFHSFFDLDKTLLVFHEIGVIALDEKGKTCWEYEEDVIEHFEISQNNLRLRFMDAAPVNINLQTGDLQKQSTTRLPYNRKGFINTKEAKALLSQ
jgi:hypothetical protein